MSLFCVFSLCRWVHIGDVGADYLDPLRSSTGYGLYQCTRCKAISIGSMRWGEKK